MHTKNRIAAAGAALALAAGLTAGTAPAASVAPSERVGHGHDWQWPAVVVPAASPRHWDPLSDAKWQLTGGHLGEVVLTEPGVAPGGPRRPFEYAIVTKGPELSSLSIGAQVRIDEAVEVTNRDVIIVWNYQSPTRFHYAHLSTDNTIYPHNWIFVVNDADRLRIDDQWDPATSRGAAPAITDAEWHDVVVTHDTRSGRIAVHVDGAREPLMTATDTTLTHGRFGFGSFDNFGRARYVRAVGLTHRPAAG
jgi:hypothetical protein